MVLVDSRDRKIGEMDKMLAHEGHGKLHRAISVFLFDSRGKLLIQKRSQGKIVCAGQWANTCCGNVRPGETRLQCARRRLKDELGIEDASVRPIYKFTYHARCNPKYSEREIDGVFVGKYDGVALPNTHEVAATSWVNLNNLPKWEYSPWFEIMLADQKLRKILAASIIPL